MERVSVMVYLVFGEKKRDLPYYLAAGERLWDGDAEDRKELRFFSEDWVRARGGLDELEYDLGEICKWFARIGQIRLPPRGGGKFFVPEAMVKSLVDDWAASGAPREIGWRQQEIELNRAAREALELAWNRGPDQLKVYQLNCLTPRLIEFPNIMRRLDAYEFVQVDLTATMSYIHKEADGPVWMGNEARECQLWIWREKAESEFKVRVQVQTEKPRAGTSGARMSEYKFKER